MSSLSFILSRDLFEPPGIYLSDFFKQGSKASKTAVLKHFMNSWQTGYKCML